MCVAIVGQTAPGLAAASLESSSFSSVVLTQGFMLRRTLQYHPASAELSSRWDTIAVSASIVVL